ncbi:metallophosphoesterase [Paraburkholderia caribensis]|uniref:metallophosphoesterase n=1 Tax=Paraburkholderia caribensis TaxID=75105 RepID=UPI00159120D8|nr:metallophosphoesterase [Paraburkholderia caribensis]
MSVLIDVRAGCSFMFIFNVYIELNKGRSYHDDMRLQIASDLHLENVRRPLRFGGLVPGRADVLILAGDIHRGSAAIDVFATWPTPVIYVLGNHEFYGRALRDLEQEICAKSVGTGIQVLANREVIWGNVRFLGCTLWTDFRLNRSHKVSMERARNAWDFRSIRRLGGGSFTPEDSLAEHNASVKWLSEVLARPFYGTTVVITHHAPGRPSLDAKFSRSHSAASFASDLSKLAGGADLWIHGHVHRSADYRLWGCKVLCNPRGRPLALSEGSVTGTNRKFVTDFVYDLNH